MIFVSVGTQLPFDRLVASVDHWCGDNGLGSDVFAQVGRLSSESYRPRNCAFAERLTHAEFSQKVAASKLIVSHAGMGSIISALTHEKPILIMPRRADLGEHRNDHQRATVERFRERKGIIVADDETELVEQLDEFAASGWAIPGGSVDEFANADLVEAVRAFIHAPK